MRLAIRLLSLTVILAFGVRQGGNPNTDTLARELGTEVAMTVEGPVFLPVFAPAKMGRRCSLPTVTSRADETQSEMIAAIVNRAAECSLLEAAAKPKRHRGEVH
jgi:hypothetical protein